MARVAYFRHAWRGMIAASTELFAKTAYTQELPAHATPLRVAYRLAWA